VQAIRVILLLCVALSAIASASETKHLGPDGYRISHYRASTPAQVPFGQTIATAELQTLIKHNNPVLIDVQAVVVRPELADFGMSWLPNKPRYHIPGSVWLPNVGYGSLEPVMDDYFRNQLEHLTAGDKNRPLVIYCVLDCWMSWNAVQRAARYGYQTVYWYRDGTDGWAEHDLPLTEGIPVPLSDD